jgi:hypothetical protein
MAQGNSGEQARSRDHLLAIPSWEQLSLGGHDLALFDVALLNLVAAQGLPTSETIDIPKLLDRLDEWADRVKLETARHMYRFGWMSQQPQTEFTVGDSLARYCCYCLLQTLQEECGVRYNPKRKFHPNYCQVPDIFIHGIVDEKGEGGTCATMPVVYVAVGRRLGYPLYLVETKGHLLFRWWSERPTAIRWASPEYAFIVPPDRFNVEGSGEGIAFYCDAHYIQWPELWKEEDFARGYFLRPLTPAEEFSSFLIERACCFEDLGRYREALDSVFNARRLSPDDIRYQAVHSQITKKCVEYEVQKLESIDRINDHNRRAMEARARAGRPPNPSARIQEQNRRIQREQDRRDLVAHVLKQCSEDPIQKLKLEGK